MFVIPDGAGFSHASRIKRSATFIPTTRYFHPTAGVIDGAWAAMDASLEMLRGCLYDVRTATTGTDLAGIQDVSDLVHPIAYLGEDDTAYLYPRTGGYQAAREFIPPGAEWVRDRKGWKAPLTSLLTKDGTLRAGIALGNEEIYQEIVNRPKRQVGADTSRLKELGTASDIGEVEDAYSAVAERVGDVPEWFGMSLYPYQRPAAMALAGGFGLLGDEPGTGKTVMALAAAAILGAKKTIIVAPAIALTHWAREVERTRLVEMLGGEILTLTSKTKKPALPESGVVILTHTLLRSRESLQKSLAEFEADLLIFDEAHNAKVWGNKTSTAMRALARNAKRTLCLTGTPLFKSPQDAMVMLDMIGCLDDVFGGYGAFVDTYLSEDRFGNLKPQKRKLGDFAKKMDEQVWIRRTKAQIQKDLPPKMRSAMFVDVKPDLLIEAHEKVLEEIGVWLEQHDHTPSADEVTAYAKANLALSSRLREAAGLAKIPATLDYVREWVDQTEKSGEGYERPLIVWVHHHVVMDALVEALGKSKIEYATLRGGMTPEQMGTVVDSFQAGQVPILVCSIHAASTGVTLTRASDELFVETDWTNSIISQAESRAHRSGQERPVSIMTMIAPGTLDVPIQKVLRENATTLTAVTKDADVNVAVLEEGEAIPGLTREISSIHTASDIIEALVYEAINRR